MANKRKRNASKKIQKNTSRKNGLSTRLTWAVLILTVAAFIWAVLIPSRNGGGTSASMTASPEQIARGEALFAKFCVQCHGPQAQGQSLSNPRGGMTDAGAYLAPALNGTGHAWHHPPEALFDIIKNGSRASDSPMRGFAGRLGDEEVWEVLGYLFSLWPPRVQSRYR